jgi:hypothetical protein
MSLAGRPFRSRRRIRSTGARGSDCVTRRVHPEHLQRGRSIGAIPSPEEIFRTPSEAAGMPGVAVRPAGKALEDTHRNDFLRVEATRAGLSHSTRPAAPAGVAFAARARATGIAKLREATIPVRIPHSANHTTNTEPHSARTGQTPPWRVWHSEGICLRG